MDKKKEKYIRKKAEPDEVESDLISFDLVDAKTIKRRIEEGDVKTPFMRTKKYLDIPKDQRWNTKALNSKLMAGILNGDSIPKIATSLQDVIGNNSAAATRNARTIITGAENAGRKDSYEDLEEQGVIQKKVWIATPDDRTRESHLLMDGEEVDIDEPFSNGLMYPGDPSGDASEVYNCRCTMRTHIVGFKKADGRVEKVGQRDDIGHEAAIAKEQAEREAEAEAKRQEKEAREAENEAKRQQEEERREEIDKQEEKKERKFDEERGFDSKEMTEQEYLDWQKEHSTQKLISDQFEEKYGVPLEKAMWGRAGEKWIEEENLWLYEIAQNESKDLAQVEAGYGKCGYIQAAEGSKAINAYLRRGEVGMYSEKEMQKTIDSMNRLVEKTTLKENMVVDRCAGIDAIERMGIEVGSHGETGRIGHAFCTEGLDYEKIVETINSDYIGSELIDNGFMSASASPEKNIFSGSDVTFTILAPQGTHAFISNNTDEAEIVFGAGTKQQIMGAKVTERSAREYDGKEEKRKTIEIFLKIE